MPCGRVSARTVPAMTRCQGGARPRSSARSPPVRAFRPRSQCGPCGARRPGGRAVQRPRRGAARELGIDARAAAAAERAGLLRRLPGNILLAPDAPERAARIGRPAAAVHHSDARQALGTTRRTAIPLLEWLDRAESPAGWPTIAGPCVQPPGSPMPNGE